MNPKKIFLGADHAGFELKEHVKKYLVKSGIEVDDKGAYAFDQGDDYPDFIVPVAKKVSQNPSKNIGIIFGSSGAIFTRASPISSPENEISEEKE